MSVYRTVSEII